jgi:hypothetical protein
MIDPVVVFQARCEARARLYGACVLDLHDAVDVLQRDAVNAGLVGLIGQDAVQAIMASAFGPVRQREIQQQPISVDDAHITNQNHGSVSAATIEALKFLVSQNDPQRLRAWLAKRSPVEHVAFKRLLVPA